MSRMSQGPSYFSTDYFSTCLPRPRSLDPNLLCPASASSSQDIHSPINLFSLCSWGTPSLLTTQNGPSVLWREPSKPTAHPSGSVPSSPALENPELPKDHGSVFPDRVGLLWLLSSTSSEEPQLLCTQFTGLRQSWLRDHAREEAEILVGRDGGWSGVCGLWS